MRSTFIHILFIIFGLISSLSAQSVVVFADTHFEGQSQSLRAGNYFLADLSIGNDVISSIRLPEGFKVLAFENDNFEGDFFEITVSLTSLDFWADRISSIKVIDLQNPNANSTPIKTSEPQKEQPTNQDGNSGNNTNNTWNTQKPTISYSASDIVIFADANFQGEGQILVEGRYNDDDLSIGNDNVSSIKIPQGYTVRLFEDGRFDGNFIDLKSEVSNLNSIRWNDRASAIQVFRGNPPTAVSTGSSATLYQHGNYGGRNQSLGEGKYTSRDFSLAQDLTSLRIAQGFYALLYEQDNFQGNSVDVSGDVRDLSDIGWNDKVKSLEIIRGISPTQLFNNNNANNNNSNSSWNNNNNTSNWNNNAVNQVIIYQSWNYGGKSQVLNEGNYANLSNLNVRNYDVSSIRIPMGFTVRLYTRENGQGSFVDINQDTPNLSNIGWDNRAMSIQVVRNNTNQWNSSSSLPNSNANNYSTLNRSYKMTQSGTDYRIRISNNYNTTQIQTQSGVSSWTSVQVTSIDNQRGIYRIRDNNNNEFDVVLKGNGSSLTLSNRTSSWSYFAE